MKETKSFYITTPIFYPNGKLHLGHAYTATIADVIARYKRLKGYQVFLQTGSDEHGEKIEQTAHQLAKSPQDLVDQNVLFFKKLWEKINLIEDYYFMRTSFPFHKEKVQKCFQELLQKGDIYLGKYTGSYCLVCEEYVLNSDTNTCPSCHSSLKEIEEPAYFLRVSRYRLRLLEYYKNNPYFLSPESSVNELFASFLEGKNELFDLCITRNDLEWGISVPGDKNKTIYVWFDALLNYLTSDFGEVNFSDKDAEILQIVGKDILRFHSIYWIIILTALGKRLPNKLIAHGWILSDGAKMSKSKKNVVDPLELIEIYGSDVLRAYFVGKIVIYKDGVLNNQLLANFYDEFFVGGIGNLFSRVHKMISIYNDCSLSPPTNFDSYSLDELVEYNNFLKKTLVDYQREMDAYELTKSFQMIQGIIDQSNKLLSVVTPWKLDKNSPLVNESLFLLFNGLKLLSLLIEPIAPICSQKMKFYLAIDSLNFDNVLENSGKHHRLRELNVHLFVPK